MERISSLQLAIDNEHREEKFYAQEAARSKNPVVKRLLEHLAKEEEQHAEWIKERHAKMTQSGQWPTEVTLQVEASTLNEELAKLDYKARETSTHDQEDIAALQMAAKFEEEATDFYMKLSNEAVGEEERAFFKSLAKLEQDHMASIRDSIGYLEDPEGWYLSNTSHIG